MPIAPTASLTVVQPSVTLADPHVLSDIRDRRSIIDSIYDSLVRRRDDGGFSPWLALDWQVHDSCRRWRFTLREQVPCHDGSLLSAEDVVASLQRALSPELPGELGTQGVLRSYLQGAEVFVADAHTVAIDSPLRWLICWTCWWISLSYRGMPLPVCHLVPLVVAPIS